MKKYIWGSYKGNCYSILEINESKDQVVLRPIGTKTHLTLHKLNIKKEEHDYWIVDFQASPMKLFKKTYAPISYNWNSPVIRGVWSDAKVGVARKLGFHNPEKHATSSQGLLVKFDNSQGYDIGSTKIKINSSMKKKKYLRQREKIKQTIPISSLEFRIRIILSTKDNKYEEEHDFSHLTELGTLVLQFEDTPAMRLNGS